jgi:lysophospholipase L1-like esterase
MKRLTLIPELMLLMSLVAIAQQIDMSKSVAKKWRGEGHVECKIGDEGELTIRALGETYEKKGRTLRQDMVAYAEVIVKNVPNHVKAIRFEAKGSPSNDGKLMSVFLSESKAYNGFEAAFFARSDQWDEITIPLRDFSQNFTNHSPDQFQAYIHSPERIRRVSFGRGRYYHRHQLSAWEISIRNVHFVSDIEVTPTPREYSKALSRTTSLIQSGEPLKILMLGDSITDSGRDTTYAFHAGKKLEEKFGVKCTIHNAGIGGHTIRAGRTVFPRSIKEMEDPDLVTIFYGANDCHALLKGMTPSDHQDYLESLIDTVRRATDGKADIMLFTGLARLTKERTESAKKVEPLVSAIKATAISRETALCDTLPVVMGLSHEERMEIYNDTIHPTKEGHVVLGGLMYEAIMDYMK